MLSTAFLGVTSSTAGKCLAGKYGAAVPVGERKIYLGGGFGGHQVCLRPGRNRSGGLCPSFAATTVLGQGLPWQDERLRLRRGICRCSRELHLLLLSRRRSDAASLPGTLAGAFPSAPTVTVAATTAPTAVVALPSIVCRGLCLRLHRLCAALQFFEIGGFLYICGKRRRRRVHLGGLRCT